MGCWRFCLGFGVRGFFCTFDVVVGLMCFFGFEFFVGSGDEIVKFS